MGQTQSTPPKFASLNRPTVRRKAEIPFRQMATCTVNQACAGTGLGRSFIYDLMKEELIQSKMVKNRRLINVPSLLKAVGVEPLTEAEEAH